MDSRGAASAAAPTANGQTVRETHSTNNNDTSNTSATTTITVDKSNFESTSLSAEDNEIMIELYQTSRAHLWPVFNGILQFCDTVDEEVIDYQAMSDLLNDIFKRYDASYLPDVLTVVKCAMAAGFVPQATKVIRRAIRAGVAFGVDSNDQNARAQAMCYENLFHVLVKFAYEENEIRLRLAKTGIFHDCVESLKTLRHSTPKTEGEKVRRLLIIGMLLNCCKNPDVAAVIKDMEIVPHLVPFLDKSEHIVIRLATFYLLAYIVVDDTQLCYLQLDHDILDCSLRFVKQALGIHHQAYNYNFPLQDTAIALYFAARFEFNQRLIVAKEGAVEFLRTGLQKGSQEDIHAILDVFAQLATDPINAKIFQRDKELMKILSGLRDQEHGQSADVATKIITRIQETVREEEDVTENTSVADVLAKQANALIILNVGKVEFILSRLDDLISGRNVSGCQATGVQMVKALRELANDDSYRREIMARGGLRLLQKFLQRDGTDDKLESILLLRDLASCKAYSVLIQADRGLMGTVQKLAFLGNQPVRQAASQLLLEGTFQRFVTPAPGETIITPTPP